MAAGRWFLRGNESTRHQQARKAQPSPAHGWRDVVRYKKDLHPHNPPAAILSIAITACATLVPVVMIVESPSRAAYIWKQAVGEGPPLPVLAEGQLSHRASPRTREVRSV
jgi:hypothetical protein